jgi:outer membrane receptor protein involved in Fe transport
MDAAEQTQAAIVVTAQSRLERLQDVPIQIAALDTQALAGAGIKSSVSRREGLLARGEAWAST